MDSTVAKVGQGFSRMLKINCKIGDSVTEV